MKKTIGQMIQERRKKLGITQERLAEIAGVSRPYINQIESRGGEKIGAEVLYWICIALGESIDNFMYKYKTQEEEITEDQRELKVEHNITPSIPSMTSFPIEELKQEEPDHQALREESLKGGFVREIKPLNEKEKVVFAVIVHPKYADAWRELLDDK